MAESRRLWHAQLKGDKEERVGGGGGLWQSSHCVISVTPAVILKLWDDRKGPSHTLTSQAQLQMRPIKGGKQDRRPRLLYILHKNAFLCEGANG